MIYAGVSLTMTFPKVTYTYKQEYKNWATPEYAFLDPTYKILSVLDSYEPLVYSDREFTMANELIEHARSNRT